MSSLVALFVYNRSVDADITTRLKSKPSSIFFDHLDVVSKIISLDANHPSHNKLNFATRLTGSFQLARTFIHSEQIFLSNRSRRLFTIFQIDSRCKQLAAMCFKPLLTTAIPQVFLVTSYSSCSQYHCCANSSSCNPIRGQFFLPLQANR